VIEAGVAAAAVIRMRTGGEGVGIIQQGTAPRNGWSTQVPAYEHQQISS
jgi:hypothetical protein